MVLQNLALIVLGVIGLTFGGNFLVDGAARLARAWGVPATVIGLTIIALGTSMPELVTVIIAALRGTSDIAIGNIVGSNIANIGLILGLTGIMAVTPLTTRGLRGEWLVMLLTMSGAALLLYDGTLGRVDGVILLVLIGLYMLRVFRQPGAADDHVLNEGTVSSTRNMLLMLGGLVLLIAGAQATVDGAVNLARAAGISELVIGVTLVAVGTSLPELATSLIAVRKRQYGLLLGNVIGSNIFNTLAMLGVAGAISPFAINPEALRFDIPVMIAFALLLGLAIKAGVLRRALGGILLLAYAAYVLVVFVK